MQGDTDTGFRVWGGGVFGGHYSAYHWGSEKISHRGCRVPKEPCRQIGKGSPGRGSGTCKGPAMRGMIGVSRTSEEASVAGVG